MIAPETSSSFSFPSVSVASGGVPWSRTEGVPPYMSGLLARFPGYQQGNTNINPQLSPWNSVNPTTPSITSNPQFLTTNFSNMNMGNLLMNYGNTSFDVSGGRRKERVIFTQQQITELKKQFIVKKYLNAQERETLAATIGLKPAQIKTWFQNQRYHYKRQKKEQKIYESAKKNEESNDDTVLDNSNLSLKLEVNSDSINVETKPDFNKEIKQSLDYSNISPTNPFFPFEQDYTVFAANCF